jgi:hypothetical protein
MRSWKALLVCYFPREVGKVQLGDAFSKFAKVESVHMIMKNGESKCYGFVNFCTHDDALRGLAATQQEQITFKDNRKITWKVKAEWANGNGRSRSNRRN